MISLEVGGPEERPGEGILDDELDRLAREKLESFKEDLGKSEFSARRGLPGVKLQRNSIDNRISVAMDSEPQIGVLNFGVQTMDPSRQT